jgi:hypothetical protein
VSKKLQSSSLTDKESVSNPVDPETTSNDLADQTLPRTDLDARETAIIPTRQLRRSKDNTDQLREEIKHKDDREIILVIRGIIERFVIPKDRKLTLGRSNARMRYVPDIDLTPYGALDRGVSRAHAQIWIENGDLYIEDMQSTNGTYVNNELIPANQPKRVSSGNELLLGRLAIQVLFR